MQVGIIRTKIIIPNNGLVNPWLNAEDVFVANVTKDDPKSSVLYGKLCECGHFLTFISGHNYTQDLLLHPKPTGIPTEFTIENWMSTENDSYIWQLKYKTTYYDVKWFNAHHNNPEDSMCAGVSDFTYADKETQEVEQLVIEIPKEVKYTHGGYKIRHPQLYLSKCLRGDICHFASTPKI